MKKLVLTLAWFFGAIQANDPDLLFQVADIPFGVTMQKFHAAMQRQGLTAYTIRTDYLLIPQRSPQKTCEEVVCISKKEDDPIMVKTITPSKTVSMTSGSDLPTTVSVFTSIGYKEVEKFETIQEEYVVYGDDVFRVTFDKVTFPAETKKFCSISLISETENKKEKSRAIAQFLKHYGFSQIKQYHRSCLAMALDPEANCFRYISLDDDIIF